MQFALVGGLCVPFLRFWVCSYEFQVFSGAVAALGQSAEFNAGAADPQKLSASLLGRFGLSPKP